jgi:3-(3-hydroxy-phenyl)propionate hydroxylase
MHEPLQCDVAIVGLGPTGTVLANLLGQLGWTVVGLEREEDLYYAPRAVHFDDEVMRVFQYAGLAAEISATSEPFTRMQFLLEPGGEPIMEMQVGSQDRRYGHAGAWWFHQPTLERHLHAGLRRFSGVKPLYGVEVQSLVQDADGVTVGARTRAGEAVSVRARFVVGCDGGRSFVRKHEGLPLHTCDFDEPWVVVSTKTRSGGKHPDLPTRLQQVCDPKQPITYVPLAGPYYEWEFMVVDGKPERTVTDPAYVREQLRQFVDLSTIEIIRIAYYKFHALWAEKWRSGRIILAGDSAHQTPPFLGQGMCSGIRDAHGLSWRLHLILAGKADVRILDDYELERSVHVQHLIHGAMFLGRIIQTRSRAVALLRNLAMRPSGAIPALNRFFYRTANRKRSLEGGFLGRNHRRLPGQLSMQPTITLADGRTTLLDEVLGSQFAILARSGTLDGRRGAIDRLRTRVPVEVVEFDGDATEHRIGDPDGILSDWFDRNGVDFVLLRPDRHVYDAGRADALDRVVASFSEQLPLPSAAQRTERKAA